MQLHYKIGVLLLLFFCCTNNYSFAQKRITTECGFKTTPQVMQAYDNLLQKGAERKSRPTGTLAFVYHVRVFIHDYISADGTDSAWKKKEVIDEFNIASDLFRPYGICLILAGVDYPRNTAYKDSFNTVHIGELTGSSSINHVSSIDVSLHKKLYDEDLQGLNGICYNIGGKWMSLSRGAINNRSFAHELGHCFGLLHTFEPVYGLECPDGSNSTTAGDKIVDTRATPVADSALAANTSVACVYSGNLSITCNGSTQNYNPEINNIMSYGRRTCRSVFSNDQVNLMKSTLDNNTVMKKVWFEYVTQKIVEPAPGFTLYLYGDTVVVGSPVILGNSANSPINLYMGGQGVQRMLSPTYIRVTPGVDIVPNSLGNSRGSVVLTPATICGPIESYRPAIIADKEANQSLSEEKKDP